MPTNFYPGNLQWIGLAKETTYGTPIATPSVWVPVVGPKWVPHITTLTDSALRGSMAKTFGLQQGLRYDEVTYQTYPYMDSVFQHFLACLGGTDTVTGSADPWTHKAALYSGSGSNSAQPPSFTVFYFDAAGKCWQVPGAVISNLAIDVKAEALVTLDVGWMGLPAAAITPPTNTPTANPPFPSWNSTITLGGSSLTKYSDVKLTYKRATEMIPTLTGTQTPVAIYAGELDVTADLAAVYQGSTDPDLVNYLTNAQPALVVKVAPAGDATHYLQLQHTKVAYTDSSVSGTNKWMELSAKAMPLANTTDAVGGGLSPVQVSFLTTASAAF